MKNLLLCAALALSACCSAKDPRPLAESYREFLNGPGRAWVAAAADDPKLGSEVVKDRQVVWDSAAALVDQYEEKE